MADIVQWLRGEVRRLQERAAGSAQGKAQFYFAQAAINQAARLAEAADEIESLRRRLLGKGAKPRPSRGAAERRSSG